MQIIENLKLFEFIRIFFTSPKRYGLISNREKKKHIFMVYRTLAIGMPNELHVLNKVHEVAHLDLLQKICYTKFKGYVPNWVSLTAKNEGVIDFGTWLKKQNKDILKLYLKQYEASLRDINSLYQLNKDELMDRLKMLEDGLVNGIEKKGKKKRTKKIK